MSVNLRGIPYGTVEEASALVEKTPSVIRKWIHDGKVRGHNVGIALLVNLEDVKKHTAKLRISRKRTSSYDRALWCRISTATHEAVRRHAAAMNLMPSHYIRLAIERMVGDYRGRNTSVQQAYYRGIRDGAAACVQAAEDVRDAED